MPASILADLALGLRDELRAFSWRSPRALHAARPVLSVLIAVTAAHALDLHDAWWAAITAFMVMQADFGASLYRGTLRIAGTLFGAALGFVLGPLGASHPLLFVVLMTMAAWGGLYAALRWPHSYAWVLALVTFAMVMCEALAGPAGLGAFALERIANILLGTLACIVVAVLTDQRVLSTVFRRSAAVPAIDPGSHWLAGRLSESPAQARGIALHALHGAVVVAILSVILLVEHLGSFAQALVTTIAVLVVPLEAGAAMPDVQGRVVQRMAQRVSGCLAAGAIAWALLPLLEGHALGCLLTLCAGAWLGAYLQGGAPVVRYMATQFSVAFLMVFVQDSGWTIDSRPAFERLVGVLAGIGALGVVLLLSGAVRKLCCRNAPSADA
ncbi:FUSC family protein [Variovorax rhizosphaerae]|uniref:FUSC family protein n=1 Tax=Variovorax rhizosphaerae TaxID=1836200 RepID=A0ABU8WBZ5_9BURK